MTTADHEDHFTIFLASLEGGGIQKATIRLINELLMQGINVTLVTINGSGPIRNEIPSRCQFVDLKCKRTRSAFFATLKYLISNHPHIGITSQTHLNVLLIILRLLCGYPKKLFVREHNTFTKENVFSGALSERIRIPLIILFYPYCTQVIAVSESVAKSIKKFTKIKKPIRIIRNGLDIRTIEKRQLDTTYLQDGRTENGSKLIVGVGRLSKQKNFQDLLKAFSILLKRIDAKLFILGEGEERILLENIANQLNIQDSVFLPGFIDNPYPIIANADVFVSSSQWEGFSNVIIEALACGAPIVATDCPGGPKDILEDKPFARIVNMGDPIALANGIEEILNADLNRNLITEYAETFDISNVAKEYVALINSE